MSENLQFMEEKDEDAQLTQNGESIIGSITSPCETGKYHMALRDYAADRQVSNQLVVLDIEEVSAKGEHVRKRILAQVTKLSLNNRHHENPLFQALIRRQGYVPGLSQVADNKIADLLPLDSVITSPESRAGAKQMPRTLPPTGTDIRTASEDDLLTFVGDHPRLLRIGYLFDSTTPFWLLCKHFGDGDNGYGDAKHMGVFGGTGSGKSVMAATIMAGFAQNSEMGMLIIDPQGEFSKGQLGKDKWIWDLDKALEKANRGGDVIKVRIDDISLEGVSTFGEMLKRSRFWRHMGLGEGKWPEATENAVGAIEEFMHDNKLDEIRKLELKDLMDDLLEAAIATYASSSRNTKRNEFSNAMTAGRTTCKRAERSWSSAMDRFAKKYSLTEIIHWALLEGKIVVVDVDVDERDKLIIFRELLEAINNVAQYCYRAKRGQYNIRRKYRQYTELYKKVEVNALIVIDEAARVAPETPAGQEEKTVLALLADAVQTTRKLNVGWMFVTQSTANFAKSIWRQLGTKVLGYGLTTGADATRVQEELVDDGLITQYNQFPNPESSGIFAYMVMGDLVPLARGRSIPIFAFPNQRTLFEQNLGTFSTEGGAKVGSWRPSLPAGQSGVRGKDIESVEKLSQILHGDSEITI
jgi:hypothetical protein